MFPKRFIATPFLNADTGATGGASGAGSTSDAGTGGQQGDSGAQQPFATFPDSASFTARMQREANSLLKQQAETLGYESVDAMLAIVKDHQTRTDAEKTEAQRLQERIQTLETSQRETLSKANERLVKADVRAACAELGIVDPDAALALMDRSGVNVDDTGNVQGVNEALTALLSSKPYLKGAPASVGGSSNPPGAVNAGKIDVSALSAAELTALQKRVMAGERVAL